MANVLDLRRRIRSVKNTRQITKAMKMVSAAKLRRAQERAMAARPYAKMITSVLESLTRRVDIYDPETGNLRHPLFATRPEKRVLLVVVSGDKGFAGAFNANILKASFQFISGNQGKEDRRRSDGPQGTRPDAPAVSRARSTTSRPTEDGGKLQVRAIARARSKSRAIIPACSMKLEAKRVFELAQNIISRYVHEEIDAAYIVYNEFKSVISQRAGGGAAACPSSRLATRQIEGATEPTLEERERAAQAAMSAGITLEEADTEEADEEAKKFGTANVDYIYEQPPEELFNGLLPQYISAMLYHAMTESVAAEHAARMTAMDSATNNASDMIDSYTLQMNRVRQAAITKEIIEIVSGAAAV